MSKYYTCEEVDKSDVQKRDKSDKKKGMIGLAEKNV